MTTNKHLNFLGHSTPFFKGVYPSDLLPFDILVKYKKISLIINLDPHTKPGSHYVALFINKNLNNKVVYFDPFGKNLTNENIIKFVKKINKNYIFSTKKIQHDNSDYCGLFCLAFCVYIYKNKPFYIFLDMFINNSMKNNFIVHRYLKENI